MPRPSMKETGNRYALCVGINQYHPSATLGNLSFAEQDAQALHDLLLQKGFASEHCRLLLGAEATSEAIHDALTTFLLSKPRKNDLVVLYFAGHGLPISLPDDEDAEPASEVFLATYNFDRGQITNDRGAWLSYPLRMRKLRTDFFENTRSRKVLFILDSCHSGDFYGSNYRDGDALAQHYIDQSFARMSAGKIVLSSCMPQQKAREDTQLGHGLFTYHLLEALQGHAPEAIHNGSITIGSLFDYLSKIMPLNQQPVKSGVEQGTFELLRYPKPAEDSPSTTPSQATAQENLSEAPDLGRVYGRTDEVATLQQWVITERCRLAGIFGMGGIGKTVLATVLAKKLQGEFEYAIWRSLRNSPPIEETLAELILFLTNQQQHELAENLDKRISQLLEYLRKHRCLLILDNIDSVLQAGSSSGQYREGYEGYGKLIERIGEVYHRSCLLITGREKPKEIARLEGLPTPVHSLQLAGVKTTEGIAILKDQGLFGSKELCSALVDLYGGNPLALKLISTPIQDVFGGNIAEFLNKGEAVFGDIHNLLDQQFARLSELEREIMYFLAIEREAVSLEVLQKDIVHVSMGGLINTLGLLRRRSFIEASGTARFTLQSVIMEYVTDKFVDQIYEEIDTGVVKLSGSHMLIKAQAKDYVRENQIRVILQPIAERLISTLGKVETEQKLRRILALLHNARPPKSYYAAGNVLNLLVHLQSDLRGWDFSHLTISHAYLQEVALPEVNFAQAIFTHAIFTDTFGSVLAVALSPHGNLLAAGTGSSEIRVWRVPEGMPLQTYQGHTDRIRSVAFSPNGQLLASSSEDQTVRLWDVSSNNHLKTLQGHIHPVRSVAFSPDGQLLASGGEDQAIRLWEVHTGRCLRTLQEHNGWVRSVAFSPDGQLLASGGEDQTIRLWEVHTGRCLKILQGDIHRVWSIAFSPDGRLLASGGDDQVVCLWEIASGQRLKALRGHSGWVRSVAFSFDGQLLASGSDDQTIRLWEIATGLCFKILQGHSSWIWSVDFSLDGKLLVSGSDDQTVRLWETSTGRCLRTLQGYVNRVRSVAFSPNGKILASGSDDQIVRLWDVTTGRSLKTLRGHTSRVWSVAFSPNNRLLASSGYDQTIRLWETVTGRCTKILHGHTNRVRSVAFSPNGKILASGSEDQTVRIWEVLTGHCIKILRGHTNRIWSIAFSPDGTLLASAGDDQSIRLWDAKTGECVNVLHGHTNRIWTVAFSPNGSLLASGSEDHAVFLWELDTGQCMKKLQKRTGGVWSIAFSPDGSMLVSGNADSTVCLWDINTEQCLKELSGHTKQVRSVALAPDGHHLASAGNDGMIIMWNLETGESIKTLRNDKPYELMNITDTEGLTDAQTVTLKALGAIEDEENPLQ